MLRNYVRLIRRTFLDISFQVPIAAAYLYDAVMLYAKALDDVLKRKESPRNGTAIISKIRNNRYQSKWFMFSGPTQSH